MDRWDWEELDDVAHAHVARSVQQLDLILADARAARDGMVGRDGIGGYPLVNIHKTMERWKDPPFLTGKSTISMAIFNSYVKLPEV